MDPFKNPAMDGLSLVVLKIAGNLDGIFEVVVGPYRSSIEPEMVSKSQPFLEGLNCASPILISYAALYFSLP